MVSKREGNAVKGNSGITIRNAEEKDLPWIHDLLRHEDMDEYSDVEHLLVACRADHPAGFIRLKYTDCGVHVAPIIVECAMRGEGIGYLLMKEASKRVGELKLVARGSAVGFYRALGMKECSFEVISTELEEDCTACSMKEDCKPIPFRGTIA